MAEITYKSPKATIQWDMGCDRKKTFIATLEDFLLCAFVTHSEAEFRALLFTLGTVRCKSRDELRNLRIPVAATEHATAVEVTEAKAAYARAAAGNNK